MYVPVSGPSGLVVVAIMIWFFGVNCGMGAMFWLCVRSKATRRLAGHEEDNDA